MNIAPSDEFLRACRLVLGDDSPATIIGRVAKLRPAARRQNPRSAR
jgi:hypothetical protein